MPTLSEKDLSNVEKFFNAMQAATKSSLPASLEGSGMQDTTSARTSVQPTLVPPRDKQQKQPGTTSSPPPGIGIVEIAGGDPAKIEAAKQQTAARESQRRLWTEVAYVYWRIASQQKNYLLAYVTSDPVHSLAASANALLDYISFRMRNAAKKDWLTVLGELSSDHVIFLLKTFCSKKLCIHIMNNDVQQGTALHNLVCAHVRQGVHLQWMSQVNVEFWDAAMRSTVDRKSISLAGVMGTKEILMCLSQCCVDTRVCADEMLRAEPVAHVTRMFYPLKLRLQHLLQPSPYVNENDSTHSRTNTPSSYVDNGGGTAKGAGSGASRMPSDSRGLTTSNTRDSGAGAELGAGSPERRDATVSASTPDHGTTLRATFKDSVLEDLARRGKKLAEEIADLALDVVVKVVHTTKEYDSIAVIPNLINYLHLSASMSKSVPPTDVQALDAMHGNIVRILRVFRSFLIGGNDEARELIISELQAANVIEDIGIAIRACAPILTSNVTLIHVIRELCSIGYSSNGSARGRAGSPIAGDMLMTPTMFESQGGVNNLSISTGNDRESSQVRGSGAGTTDDKMTGHGAPTVPVQNMSFGKGWTATLAKSFAAFGVHPSHSHNESSPITSKQVSALAGDLSLHSYDCGSPRNLPHHHHHHHHLHHHHPHSPHPHLHHPHHHHHHHHHHRHHHSRKTLSKIKNFIMNSTGLGSNLGAPAVLPHHAANERSAPLAGPAYLHNYGLQSPLVPSRIASSAFGTGNNEDSVYGNFGDVDKSGAAVNKAWRQTATKQSGTSRKDIDHGYTFPSVSAGTHFGNESFLASTRASTQANPSFGGSLSYSSSSSSGSCSSCSSCSESEDAGGSTSAMVHSEKQIMFVCDIMDMLAGVVEDRTMPFMLRKAACSVISQVALKSTTFFEMFRGRAMLAVFLRVLVEDASADGASTGEEVLTSPIDEDLTAVASPTWCVGSSDMSSFHLMLVRALEKVYERLEIPPLTNETLQIVDLPVLYYRENCETFSCVVELWNRVLVSAACDEDIDESVQAVLKKLFGFYLHAGNLSTSRGGENVSPRRSRNYQKRQRAVGRTPSFNDPRSRELSNMHSFSGGMGGAAIVFGNSFVPPSLAEVYSPSRQQPENSHGDLFAHSNTTMSDTFNSVVNYSNAKHTRHLVNLLAEVFSTTIHRSPGTLTQDMIITLIEMTCAPDPCMVTLSRKCAYSTLDSENAYTMFVDVMRVMDVRQLAHLLPLFPLYLATRNRSDAWLHQRRKWLYSSGFVDVVIGVLESALETATTSERFQKIIPILFECFHWFEPSRSSSPQLRETRFCEAFFRGLEKLEGEEYLVMVIQALLNAVTGNYGSPENPGSFQRVQMLGLITIATPNCAADRPFFLDLIPVLAAMVQNNVELHRSITEAVHCIMQCTMNVKSPALLQWALETKQTSLLPFLELPVPVIDDLPYDGEMRAMQEFWCPILNVAPTRSEIRFNCTGGVVISFGRWPEKGFSISAMMRFEELYNVIPLFHLHSLDDGTTAGFILAGGDSVQLVQDGKKTFLNESHALQGLHPKKWLQCTLVLSVAHSVSVYVNGYRVGTCNMHYFRPGSEAIISIGFVSKAAEDVLFSIGDIVMWNEELTEPQVEADLAVSSFRSHSPKLLEREIPRALHSHSGAMPVDDRIARFVPYHTSEELLKNVLTNCRYPVVATLVGKHCLPPSNWLNYRLLFLGRGGLIHLLEWIGSATTSAELELFVSLFSTCVRDVTITATRYSGTYLLLAQHLKKHASLITPSVCDSLLHLATSPTMFNDHLHFVIINRLMFDYILCDTELYARINVSCAVGFLKSIENIFSVGNCRYARRNAHFVIAATFLDRLLISFLYSTSHTDFTVRVAIMNVAREVVVASDFSMEVISCLTSLAGLLSPTHQIVESRLNPLIVVTVPASKVPELSSAPITTTNYLCTMILRLLVHFATNTVFMANFARVVTMEWFISCVVKYADPASVVFATRLFCEALSWNSALREEFMHNLATVIGALEPHAMNEDLILLLLSTTFGAAKHIDLLSSKFSLLQQLDGVMSTVGGSDPNPVIAPLFTSILSAHLKSVIVVPSCFRPLNLTTVYARYLRLGMRVRRYFVLALLCSRLMLSIHRKRYAKNRLRRLGNDSLSRSMRNLSLAGTRTTSMHDSQSHSPSPSRSHSADIQEEDTVAYEPYPYPTWAKHKRCLIAVRVCGLLNSAVYRKRYANLWANRNRVSDLLKENSHPVSLFALNTVRRIATNPQMFHTLTISPMQVSALASFAPFISLVNSSVTENASFSRKEVMHNTAAADGLLLLDAERTSQAPARGYMIESSVDAAGHDDEHDVERPFVPESILTHHDASTATAPPTPAARQSADCMFGADASGSDDSRSRFVEAESQPPETPEDSNPLHLEPSNAETLSPPSVPATHMPANRLLRPSCSIELPLPIATSNNSKAAAAAADTLNVHDSPVLDDSENASGIFSDESDMEATDEREKHKSAHAQSHPEELKEKFAKSFSSGQQALDNASFERPSSLHASTYTGHSSHGLRSPKIREEASGGHGSREASYEGSSKKASARKCVAFVEAVSKELDSSSEEESENGSFVYSRETSQVGIATSSPPRRTRFRDNADDSSDSDGESMLATTMRVPLEDILSPKDYENVDSTVVKFDELRTQNAAVVDEIRRAAVELLRTLVITSLSTLPPAGWMAGATYSSCGGLLFQLLAVSASSHLPRETGTTLVQFFMDAVLKEVTTHFSYSNASMASATSSAVSNTSMAAVSTTAPGSFSGNHLGYPAALHGTLTGSLPLGVSPIGTLSNHPHLGHINSTESLVRSFGTASTATSYTPEPTNATSILPLQGSSQQLGLSPLTAPHMLGNGSYSANPAIAASMQLASSPQGLLSTSPLYAQGVAGSLPPMIPVAGSAAMAVVAPTGIQYYPDTPNSATAPGPPTFSMKATSDVFLFNILRFITLLVDFVALQVVEITTVEPFFLALLRSTVSWPARYVDQLRSQTVRCCVSVLNRPSLNSITAEMAECVCRILSTAVTTEWIERGMLDRLFRVLYRLYTVIPSTTLSEEDSIRRRNAAVMSFRVLVRTYFQSSELRKTLTLNTLTQRSSIFDEFTTCLISLTEEESSIAFDSYVTKNASAIDTLMNVRPKKKADEAHKFDLKMRSDHIKRVRAFTEVLASINETKSNYDLDSMRSRYISGFSSYVETVTPLDGSALQWLTARCCSHETSTTKYNTFHCYDSLHNYVVLSHYAKSSIPLTSDHSVEGNKSDSFVSVKMSHSTEQRRSMLDGSVCNDSQLAASANFDMSDTRHIAICEQVNHISALLPMHPLRGRPSICDNSHVDPALRLSPSAISLLSYMLEPNEILRYLTNGFRINGIHTTPCLLLITNIAIKAIAYSYYTPSGDIILCQYDDGDATSGGSLNASVTEPRSALAPDTYSGWSKGAFSYAKRFAQRILDTKAKEREQRREGTKVAKSVRQATSQSYRNLYWVFLLKHISRVKSMTFMHQSTAVRITFLHDESSIFSIVDSELSMNPAARAAFLKVLRSELKQNNCVFADETQGLSTIRDSIVRWSTGNMSTFEYLMCINDVAGRCFRDFNQYPVVPWVIADYASPKLDFTDSKTFRNFAFPMGAQTEERQLKVQTMYNQLIEIHNPEDGTSHPFHHGTHYSTSGGVLYFLLRVQPYTSFARLFQGGTFDVAARLFSSVAMSYQSCINGPADCKELVPEFYVTGMFLKNTDHLALGVREDGCDVDDVALPPWANGSVQVFTETMRWALESTYTSDNIHQWIDLIFGNKRQGKLAIESLNVFQHMTYGEEVAKALKEARTPHDIDVIVAETDNFGQSPQQVFTEAHPKRGTVQLSLMPMSVMPQIGNMLAQALDNSTKSSWFHLRDPPLGALHIVPSSLVRDFLARDVSVIGFATLQCSEKVSPAFRQLLPVNDGSHYVCWHDQESRLMRFDATTGAFISCIQFETADKTVLRITAAKVCTRESLVILGMGSGVIYSLFPEPEDGVVLLKNTLCYHTHSISGLVIGEHRCRLLSFTNSGDDMPIVSRIHHTSCSKLHTLDLTGFFPHAEDRVVVAGAFGVISGTSVVLTQRSLAVFDLNGQPIGAGSLLLHDDTAPMLEDDDGEECGVVIGNVDSKFVTNMTCVAVYDTKEYASGVTLYFTGHQDGSIWMWKSTRRHPSEMKAGHIAVVEPHACVVEPPGPDMYSRGPITVIKQERVDVPKFYIGYRDGSIQDLFFDFPNAGE